MREQFVGAPGGMAGVDVSRLLLLLASAHVVVIAASNYLVQIPFQFFGFHSTWGALSFPLIFVLTDLTVRVYGQAIARRVIVRVMVPALVLSYVLSVLFQGGVWQGVGELGNVNLFVARIAFASFLAYLIGQLLDARVFERLKALGPWWLAPAASTLIGNAVDTALFFSVAFFRSPDPFMATHWVEIALVDYGFKLAFSLLFFLPVYKLALNRMVGRAAASAPV
jgi:queuosine precursor transporter